ncbi:hypothetical protein [Actinotalea subterranea]|uniref:restriction system modified-DNA reader domain-containing protein n=1 Tax=Actinotalea subterranea TaxID=2607497 RepID=UPI0011EBAF7C|nr:hypothetical protein [Actinotalea subterranea]
MAVHPLRPARSSFGAETPVVVADHLDTLLGEKLLPLRIRQLDADEPYLLAVDAAGQPVVVEVVALLDEVAVLRALRYAGRAARLSTQDLARAYRGGQERFATHLAAFRETVPATSLLSTSVRGGARLLLVCSDIDEGMEEVVEFLLQPGWQVEVLQVGVIEGADGARIVDVSPIRRTPPARRAMEPTSLRLVRSADVPGSPGTPPRGVLRTTPPGGLSRVPLGGPPPAGFGHRPPTGPPVRTPALQRPASILDGTDLPRHVPSVVAPPFAVRVGEPSGAARPPAQAPEAASPTPAWTSTASYEPGYAAAPAGASSGWASAPTLAPITAPTRTVGAGPAASHPAPPPGLPYAFTGVTPPPVGAAADRRIADVARAVGAPAALVWARERRGEFHEALLHPDGAIELPDGSRHLDPDAAAYAITGGEIAVDGWAVWRIDRADGRSLADVAADLHR